MIRRNSYSTTSLSKCLVEDHTDTSDSSSCCSTSSFSSPPSSPSSMMPPIPAPHSVKRRESSEASSTNTSSSSNNSSPSLCSAMTLCKLGVLAIALNFLQVQFLWVRECDPAPFPAGSGGLRARMQQKPEPPIETMPPVVVVVEEKKVPQAPPPTEPKQEEPTSDEPVQKDKEEEAQETLANDQSDVKEAPETQEPEQPNKQQVEKKEGAEEPKHEMELLVEQLAQVWQPYNAGKQYDYCITADQEKAMEGYGGILYSKLYKTGSTTGAAATLHMAHRIAARKNMTEPCKTQVDHPWSLDNRAVERADKQFSALWSSIRKPDSRALSAYYFYRVGFGRHTPKDEAMIKFMATQKNNQFIQLRTNRTHSAQGMNAVKAEQNEQVTHLSLQEWGEILRQEIMPTYDFLAVTERMEESLVALQLLWGLEDGDIVLYPGKTGEWSHDWVRRGTCFRTPKTKTDSPVVWDWIKSNFTAGNADYLLYAVAERSLDLTIETHWGREKFDAVLARHRALKAVALEQCHDKATFPCSETGEWQDGAKEDCYMRDIGCGYRCVDQVLDKYEKGDLKLEI